MPIAILFLVTMFLLHRSNVIQSCLDKLIADKTKEKDLNQRVRGNVSVNLKHLL